MKECSINFSSKSKAGNKHKRWCSKHQVVHSEHTNYWSCRYPNDKKRNKEMLEWRKNSLSLE